MSNPLDAFLAALRNHGHEPRKSGAGWTCRCPAHDDRTPSLTIDSKDDGTVLVNCHTGCSAEAVCVAVGLTLRDLFPEPSTATNGRPRKPRRRGDGDETSRTPPRGGGSVTVANVATPNVGERAFTTARDAVAELERRHGPRSAVWTYRDAYGVPVGLVVRWDIPADPGDTDSKPSKRILPVSKTASGWALVGMPNPRPLYGLPALLASPAESRVYVTEGEKAADAVRAVGLVATTSPHGAKSAGKADWSPLAGRDVVILPDHDKAGEDYADAVARLATAAGARSVRVVRLVELWADMPEGGDMADLLNHRGGDADPIRAEVEALTNKTDADTVTPEAPAVSAFRPFPAEALPESIRAHILTTAKSMDVDPVFLISPALSTFAGAVGNSVRVMVYSGWTEPCCLWCGLISLPGSLKTQTQAAVTKPMEDAQRRADKVYADLVRDFKSASEDRDLVKKSKIETSLPPAPEPPVRQQWMVSDTTAAALVQVLSGNPRGIVSLHDELQAFFGGLGRFAKTANGGEPDAAFYKSAFNGKSHTENRKGENGRGTYVRLEAPLVCVAGAIQPGAFQRIVTRQYIEDGLASRFLWAWPPDRPGGWVDEHSDDPKPVIEYAAAYERLGAIPLNIAEDGKLHPAIVGLSLPAKPIAKAWVDALRDRMKEEEDGAVRAALAKLKGVVFRVALLFHLIDWAGRGGLGDFGSISADTLARAIKVVDWFAAEARRVYSMLGETDEEGEHRELVEWLERKGGTATARDLTRGPRKYRRDPERASKALADLVASGAAMWVPDDSGSKGGRPTDRVRLVSRGGDTGDGDETPSDAN